jgi:hypothetical protein
METKPVWLDGAWLAYSESQPKLIAFCEEAKISLASAYRLFHVHYGSALYAKRAAHANATKAARQQEMKTPELVVAFETYRDDPTMTIDRMAGKMNLSGAGLWQKLSRAWGTEFREITRTRKRGRKPGQSASAP